MPRTERFNNFFAGKSEARLFKNSSGKVADSGDCPDGGLRGQVKNEDDHVEILLHDAIGDSWEGSDSATIARTFKANRGKKIVMNVNSFGGSAYDGIAIYNAAAQHDAVVEAHITGIAHSAASLLVMAADTIKIAENGSLGIHPASLWIRGNQYTMQDAMDWLATLDKQIVDTYVARTGISEKELTSLFVGKDHDGTIFSGKDAFAKGFADELLPLKKKTETTSDADLLQKIKQRIEDRDKQWAALDARARMAVMRQKLFEGK